MGEDEVMGWWQWWALKASVRLMSYALGMNYVLVGQRSQDDDSPVTHLIFCTSKEVFDFHFNVTDRDEEGAA